MHTHNERRLIRSNLNLCLSMYKIKETKPKILLRISKINIEIIK